MSAASAPVFTNTLTASCPSRLCPTAVPTTPDLARRASVCSSCTAMTCANAKSLRPWAVACVATPKRVKRLSTATTVTIRKNVRWNMVYSLQCFIHDYWPLQRPAGWQAVSRPRMSQEDMHCIMRPTPLKQKKKIWVKMSFPQHSPGHSPWRSPPRPLRDPHELEE